MTETTDILIIGGGISGLLTARELRLAGCNVTVLDCDALGQQSSWAGGGILLPIYPWRQPAAISDLVIPSIAAYPRLQAEILSATAMDPQWRPCGMWISQNPDLDLAKAWCTARGLAFQAGASFQPAGVQASQHNALWLPEVAQIRNPRLLKSLTVYLRQLGVRFIEHALITGIETTEDRVVALTTTQHRWQFRHLVLAAGAWTAQLIKQLLPDVQQDLQVKPVKGQMLLFAAPADLLSCMVLDGDRYLIPRADGRILAGSTVEDVGFDKTTTAAARDALYQFAVDLLPALKHYGVEAHWAGLRPGSPDGVPTIGLHPQLTNLGINVGHFRNGLVMGPASAQLLADLILQRQPELNPDAYAWCI